MSNPFVAEIRIFPFNFAPKGWAFCNGQILPISQNTALFSLLGTTYGGNGSSTFALPNLQGATPMHFGQGPGLSLRDLGESGGESTITLLASEIPSHTHSAQCNSGMGDQYGPPGNFWATDAGGNNEYGSTSNNQMAAGAIGTTGSSQPHNNMQPYLVLSFCIALQGVFPARN
ncbi:MAG TPA: tail fiber protein [Candidatus Limnocylindrales bacterium]|nr:tail fiber protein [Candidatus Limnocylindrales bacterium]